MAEMKTKSGVKIRKHKKNTVNTKPQKKSVPPKVTIKKKSQPKKRPLKKTLGLPEQLRDSALKILDDRQAEEIVTINLLGRSSMADYLIIASARAARQITAIADYLREAFFKLGIRHVRVEGRGDANWVLVDAGDVVIHLFRPEVRKYYDLDAIWSRKL